MWDPYAEFEEAVLPNGLTVYAAHWPHRTWQHMNFVIHAGAELDLPGKEGTAHFVEHLISANAKVPGHKIYDLFDDQGGSAMLGGTDYKATAYRFFAPTDQDFFSKALDLYGAMLLASSMEKDVEKERQVIVGEFNRSYPTTKQYDLHMREHAMLFKGHWLERSCTVLGNPDTLAAITQADLQTYYDTYYTPRNMSVVAVGGLRLEEVVQRLTQSPFAVNKKGERVPQPKRLASVETPAECRHVFEYREIFSGDSMPKAAAYKSVVILPGIISDSVIRVLTHMLNHVLTVEVRENRRWAYHIGAKYYDHRYFYEFTIECNGLALEALDSIEELIEECISSLGCLTEMFEQKKSQILAGFKLSDSTGGEVAEEAETALSDSQRIITISEQYEQMRKLEYDEVRQALFWFTPERRWTLISRP